MVSKVPFRYVSENGVKQPSFFRQIPSAWVVGVEGPPLSVPLTLAPLSCPVGGQAYSRCTREPPVLLGYLEMLSCHGTLTLLLLLFCGWAKPLYPVIRNSSALLPQRFFCVLPDWCMKITVLLSTVVCIHCLYSC